MAIFSKNYFGIDIYDNSIKIIELSGNPNSAILKHYNNLNLQPNIVQNGKVINSMLLSKAIQQAIWQAKPQKISTKNCLLALPESNLILAHTKVAKNISDQELAVIILENIQPQIPFNLEDIYYDYKTVLEYKSSLEVLFVGVKKQILDEFILIFKALGLKLDIVDFESACLSRSLIANCNMNETCAIIDIGGKTTIFSIYDFCNISCSNNISIAGDEFTKAIQNKWDLSYQEAEEFKNSYGLDPINEEGKVLLVLEKPIQEILTRIKNNIYKYQEKNNRKITKIILAGGSSQLPKISNYFQKKLNIKTELGNPFLKIKDSLDLKNKIDYATVAGLALRGLEKDPLTSGINLLKNIKI